MRGFVSRIARSMLGPQWCPLTNTFGGLNSPLKQTTQKVATYSGLSTGGPIKKSTMWRNSHDLGVDQQVRDAWEDRWHVLPSMRFC